MTGRALLATAVVCILTGSAAAQVAEGDALYARRGEGHQGAQASSKMIDAAIAAYQKAVAQAPQELEPRARLLRAIRYKGAYVARTNEEKKSVYATGKKVSAEAMAVVGQKLRPIAPKEPTDQHLATLVRSIPFATDIYYWDSVMWGEWAVAYGKMAALREGAADRIRRSATIAMIADPRLEGGGGARVLGRLHNQTPRVPFVTGWASDAEAVKLLTQSVEIDPSIKITKVFLAEAIYAADRKRRPEAVKILREVISSSTDAAFIVEDLAAQNDARALLKMWGGS